MARGRIEVPLEKLVWASQQENSATAAANVLGLSYATFKRRCLEAGIPFKTNPSGKGQKRPAPWLEVPLEKVLSNEYFMTGQGLKRKLIAAKLMEDKCSECGLLPMWNGKKLTLQLDHIDGNRADNSLGNLRLLCPNCHTQTHTFSKGKFRNKAHVAKLVSAPA
jgi:HNH endonuclease